MSDIAALRIALPERSAALAQDAEWFVVEVDGQWREMRFHDYGDIYDQPGLYERLFYDVLECNSPTFVSERLMAALKGDKTVPGDLRVLDLGAGNGIMAETLRQHGVEFVVGTDILPQAEAAAARDRPGVYSDYIVADLAELTAGEQRTLDGKAFNCLTCVAALGFGDIPPECFRNAFNLVADDGWIAFTIREDFLSDADTSGFARLIRDIVKDELLQLVNTQTYPHRLSTSGEQLHYTAVIGTKIADIPAAALSG